MTVSHVILTFVEMNGFRDVVDIRLRLLSGAAPWCVSLSIRLYATVLIPCYSVLSHYSVAYIWPLCVNMMSFIKPHNAMPAEENRAMDIGKN